MHLREDSSKPRQTSPGSLPILSGGFGLDPRPPLSLPPQPAHRAQGAGDGEPEKLPWPGLLWRQGKAQNVFTFSLLSSWWPSQPAVTPLRFAGPRERLHYITTTQPPRHRHSDTHTPSCTHGAHRRPVHTLLRQLGCLGVLPPPPTVTRLWENLPIPCPRASGPRAWWPDPPAGSRRGREMGPSSGHHRAGPAGVEVGIRRSTFGGRWEGRPQGGSAHRRRHRARGRPAALPGTPGTDTHPGSVHEAARSETVGPAAVARPSRVAATRH